VGNVDCPDYKTIAVTPDKLKEYWARDWWEPRHQEKLRLIKQGPVDLLMIGDSITEGWAKEGKESWAQYYEQRNAVNLGFGGDRTENVLWRLQHGEIDGINPKVAVLMIGTNNTGHRLQSPHYTAEGIQRLLVELRNRLPSTNILLLAVFPRGESRNDPARKINDEINRLIEPFADNQKIFYLNINHIFLTADGKLSREVMPDLLHLNAASYAAWAAAMEPMLSKLMRE
jgi:beta-glucosidase